MEWMSRMPSESIEPLFISRPTAQRIALLHPCYLAGETVHPRFGHRSGAWSLILTINTGYE
jgi:hypothetical protein